MTKLTNPYWYKLIKLFKTVEAQYKISTGLTIPFLFGAYKTLEDPLPDIDTLLRSIVDSEIDKYPIIHRCPEIGKHVILVEEKSRCNKEFKDYRRIESEKGQGILLVSTNANVGKTLDQISNNLKLEYQDPISRNEYSWSNRANRWRKFDSREEEIIKSLK